MNKIVNRAHKWCCYCSLYKVGTNQKYEVTVTAEWAIIFGINVTSSRLLIAGAYPGVTGVSPPSWMRFCYLNKPRLERGSVRENWSVLLEINGQWVSWAVLEFRPSPRTESGALVTRLLRFQLSCRSWWRCLKAHEVPAQLINGFGCARYS